MTRAEILTRGRQTAMTRTAANFWRERAIRRGRMKARLRFQMREYRFARMMRRRAWNFQFGAWLGTKGAE